MKKKKAKQAAPSKSTLDDLKLQTWTPERMMRAQELGMLFPNLGKQEWDQYNRTGVYPGAAKDVSIFLLLSITPSSEVDSVIYEDAKKFGIKRGIHFGDSDEFWQPYEKFKQTINDVRAAATKPKTEEGSGTEDEEFPKS